MLSIPKKLGRLTLKPFSGRYMYIIVDACFFSNHWIRHFRKTFCLTCYGRVSIAWRDVMILENNYAALCFLTIIFVLSPDRFRKHIVGVGK